MKIICIIILIDYICLIVNQDAKIMTPKETIIEFNNQLISLGIDTGRFSHSSTSFGDSSYLYVGELKLRASDHSVTSISRILSEIPVCEMFWFDSLEKVERHFYPERYKESICEIYGDAHFFPKDKLSTITCAYKLVSEGSSFISKKGRVMVKIQKLNKSIVTYIKK